MNCAGRCVEESGLGRARRASLLRSQLQQPQQPRILRLQLLNLALQCRKFSIQGLGLHTFHLPLSRRGSVGTIVSRPAVPFVLAASEPGNIGERQPFTTLRSAE